MSNLNSLFTGVMHIGLVDKGRDGLSTPTKGVRDMTVYERLSLLLSALNLVAMIALAATR